MVLPCIVPMVLPCVCAFSEHTCWLAVQPGRKAFDHGIRHLIMVLRIELRCHTFRHAIVHLTMVFCTCSQRDAVDLGITDH